MHCENHPEKETTIRCHYCWKFICPDCQIKLGDQLFCSYSCYTSFFISNFKVKARRILFQQNFYLRTKVNHFNKYSTLALFLIVLSIGFFLFFSRLTEDRPTFQLNKSSTLPLKAQLQAMDALPPQLTSEADYLWDQNLTFSESSLSKNLKSTPKTGLPPLNSRPESSLYGIEENLLLFPIHLNPEYQSTPPPYIVAICGEAPDNSIAALYHNGVLADTVASKNGRFLFSRVTLKKDRNILQAKVITPEGNFGYSNKLELKVDVASSQVQEKGIDIRRGNTLAPSLSLTFDGGANADASMTILNVLKDKGVQTTFFLTGEFIRKNPKVVLRMIGDGHEIGNHTDTHPHLTKSENDQMKCLPWVNREFVHHELKKAEEALYQLTGKNMSPYWRSPYGESNLEIRKWAEELGYTHVSWTCGRAWEDGLDSLDWVTDTTSGRYHSAKEICHQIINFGAKKPDKANGGIVLMHLSTSRPPEDAVYTHLAEIVGGLQQKGYAIVKVSELFKKQPSASSGGKKTKQAKKGKAMKSVQKVQGKEAGRRLSPGDS